MVDLSKSTHHGVANAIRQVNAVHANPIGFVVNRDRGAVGGAYGYYGYGYGYGEGGDGRSQRAEATPAREPAGRV
jgi:hypothetical protein